MKNKLGKRGCKKKKHVTRQFNTKIKRGTITNNGDENIQQQGSCKTYLKDIIHYDNDCALKAFEINTMNSEEHSSHRKQSSYLVDHKQDSVDADHGNNYNHGVNNDVNDYCNGIDSVAAADNLEEINFDTTAYAAVIIDAYDGSCKNTLDDDNDDDKDDDDDSAVAAAVTTDGDGGDGDGGDGDGDGDGMVVMVMVMVMKTVKVQRY